MAWFYTVLLAGCSVGIVAVGAVMTHRIFRDETLSRSESTPSTPADAR